MIKWLSWGRIWAIVMVIVVHTCHDVLWKFPNVGADEWWSANLIDSFARWCVPVLVMITGYLSIEKYDNLVNFLKKRVVRVVVPFVFWSLVYWIVREIYDGREINFLSFLSELFRNNIKYHLWFVYMIIPLYLLTPGFVFITKKINTKLVALLALLLLASTWREGKYYIYEPGYAGYFLLGWLLVKAHKDNLLFKFSEIMVVVGWVMTFLMVYLKSAQQGWFADQFYAFTYISVCTMAVGIFGVLRKYFDQIEIPNLGKIWERESFGVYLVHVFFIELTNSYNLNYQVIHPVVGIPLQTILVATLSLVTVVILKKNKKVDLLVG